MPSYFFCGAFTLSAVLSSISPRLEVSEAISPISRLLTVVRPIFTLPYFMDFSTTAFQEAISILAKELSQRTLYPGYKVNVPLEIRKILIEYAERWHLRADVEPQATNYLMMQHLITRSVAAAFGKIDNIKRKNPFKNPALIKIYDSEKSQRRRYAFVAR
jgi:hypothetical protein